jgi:Calcineurin-like phosphoesterase superfamily domain
MNAIISDIHGNLEAFEAVLADVSLHNVDSIYCLGDLVGFGPNPRECVDLAMQCRITLLGEFDRRAIEPAEASGHASDPTDTSVTRWTREELLAPLPSRASAEARLSFLRGLRMRHHEGPFLFVHGSPREPVAEFVFPEDVNNQRKMVQLFAHFKQYCLHGHSHLAGLLIEDWRKPSYQFRRPEDLDYVYELDKCKVLCDVGSVGQPRDGDWRACYVLLDERTIRFRRIEYDRDTTMRKLGSGPHL